MGAISRAYHSATVGDRVEYVQEHEKALLFVGCQVAAEEVVCPEVTPPVKRARAVTRFESSRREGRVTRSPVLTN